MPRKPAIYHTIVAKNFAVASIIGAILDGANRYRACIESGVEPIMVPYSGNDPLQFVLSENLHRRHLTAGQHAAMVAAATDWLEAETHGGDRKSAKCNGWLAHAQDPA